MTENERGRWEHEFEALSEEDAEDEPCFEWRVGFLDAVRLATIVSFHNDSTIQ